MAHHSSEMSDAMRRQMEEFFPRLGATGKFPQGHLSPEDEGELMLGIGVMDGKVILNFGKPVMWIGFDHEQAIQLAQMLYDKASDAARGEGR